MIYMSIYRLVLIFIPALVVFGCNPNFIKSINHEYKNTFDNDDEYVKSGFIKNYLEARKVARENYLEDFFRKNDIDKERLYLIEIHNEQSKRLDVYIYAENSNLEKYYLKNSISPYSDIYEFNPDENFDTSFYQFIISKAKEEKFEELKQGSFNYPSSIAGVVYLVIVDYKNLNDFKLFESLVFEEYREY